MSKKSGTSTRQKQTRAERQKSQKQNPPKNTAPASRSTSRPLIDFLYYALALLGIIVVVHLFIQTGRGFDRGCFGFSAPEEVESSFNCEAVIESDAGKLLGVSNTVWGLLFYVTLAGVSFLAIRQDAGTAVRTRRIRWLMIGVGLLYSAYLSYVQYFQLGEFCKLCLTSASIVFLLAIVSAVDLSTRSAGDR